MTSTPLATVSPRALGAAEVELTANEWAQLLGVTKKAFTLRRVPHARMVARAGGLTKVYPFSDLPADYQRQLEEQRRRQGCWSYADLLNVRAVETRWEPAKEIGTLPPASQEKATRVREVMSVYFAASEAGMTLSGANQRARAKWVEVFGEECNEKTIRRWADKIEARGGPQFAPLEAYADNKSVPHERARLATKLEISPDLIAEFKCRCVDNEAGSVHISGAVRSLMLDWQNGRPIPGLGLAPHKGAAFPFTYHQLRPFAPALAVRRLGTHGKAAALREAIPHGKQTAAFLRRMELVVMDDSRIDIIGTDDLTGRPVELKSYWLMDVGSRRIEGFLLREAGAIKGHDVDALLARVFRSTGIAAPGCGYVTTVRFERGAVACTPAKETFLRSAFPGQVHIDRTGVDGGRNFAGDHVQDSSGRWMDKAHIESFMRTLAYFIEHVPGQRGGSYARQPAALGLRGRDHATGSLLYNRGSQIHDAALLQGAERAMALCEGDLEARIAATVDRHEWANGRLKVSSLKPVSWILDALKEFVAYYNSRTDHRMEGFRRVEFLGEKGELRVRMESPNERAAWLDEAAAELCGRESCLDRISPSAVSQLLLRARRVVVRRNGVLLDCAPYKGMRFWREGSAACREAGLLTTGEKEFVALVDEDALRQCEPTSQPYTREIYLLGNTLEAFRAGERAQFIEALPLYDPGDLTDPQDLARALDGVKREERRLSAELVRDSAPALAERLANAQDNVHALQAVVTANDTAVRLTSKDGPLLRRLADARAAGAAAGPVVEEDQPTRAEQMQGAEGSYADIIAAQMAAEDEAG